MNERIKELAEDAGWRDTPTVRDAFAGFNKEKFAELLLEEVMQTLFINGYVDAFDMLNKHFGVEE